MTFLDRVLLLGLVSLALGLMLILSRLPGGSRFVVEQDGRIVYRAPLSQPLQVRFDGPLGATELVVAEGTVRIVDSPCPHKVCIGMGRAGREGEWLACVPNRLLVRVEGGTSSVELDYDLLSR